MRYREAQVADIEELAEVRLSVRENPLPDPALITYADYKEFLTVRGKGWVCEGPGVIVGFSVVDLTEHNIWALFVHPAWERRGIGTALQRLMLDWYFAQTKETVWLGTAPRSRAETFYRKSGWVETGRRPNGEIRFEMTHDQWKKNQAISKPHT
jgi:GNAT superfamily N-acetyltransferase